MKILLRSREPPRFVEIRDSYGSLFRRRNKGASSPGIDPKNLPANVKLLSGVEPVKGESSAAIQKAIEAGGPTGGLFDPAVKEVIERLGLYQPVSEDLAALQKSLFEESWKGFLNDLKSACPSALNQQACAGLASNWETVSIIDADQINPTDQKNASGNFLVYKGAILGSLGGEIYRHGAKITARLRQLRKTRTRRKGYELQNLPGLP